MPILLFFSVCSQWSIMETKIIFAAVTKVRYAELSINWAYSDNIQVNIMNINLCKDSST